MQMNILFYISAFLTGILASMGLGGGMILILYMTLIAGMEQLTAQGVNLLFFIPIAAAALIIHTKNKLVKWKKNSSGNYLRRFERSCRNLHCQKHRQ